MKRPGRRASGLLALLLLSCDGDDGGSAPCFRDVTLAAGITFRHENGGSGRKHFVEINGSGAAWLDADGDGDLDLYLVQGAALPGFTPGGDAKPLRNALLRNDRTATTPLHFTDVTDAARLGGNGRHGMGAAAADYDNDGDTDLYVSNFGQNVLYRNDGAGSFTDVTEQARVADGERYHSSCAWADFDRDGDLDLYVVGYVDYRLDDGKVCGEIARGPQHQTYCHPDMYEGIDDAIYRNDGDGTFTDVSSSAGISGRKGKGLGVAAADFDGDGDLDLFVANDSDPNFLWRNDSPRAGPIRFTDVASPLGVDYNGEGRTSSCMGAAFADVNGDGGLDLFTTTLSNEYNILWLLEGDQYRDRSHASGLAAPSLPLVGFGTVIADFDNDCDLDVAVANGHVLDNAELVLTGTTFREQASLYWNDGTGHFRLAPPSEAGGYFGEAHVGRGLAAADVDDDGDLDLLFTHNDEGPRLLLNEIGSARSWIGFILVGRRGLRDAIGAELRIRTRGNTLLRTVRGAESYLSTHDLRVLVGLGEDPGPIDAEIRWPGGERQPLSKLPTRRYVRVEEPQ